MRLLLLMSMLLLLGGCGKSRLSRLTYAPACQFTACTSHDDLVVQARICPHQEVMNTFVSAEDLYHYYHLIHVRVQNTGYVRYTLQSEGNSFFVPPAETLRRYTHSSLGGGSVLFSFLNAVLFFPVYVISLLKSAVESPAYLAQPDLVVPRSFAWLSALYAGVVLLPLMIGSAVVGGQNAQFFREASRAIVTQRQEYSCDPFSTTDVLLITPRAGFTTPCSIAFYNHKTYCVEKVSLPVKMVW